MSGNDKIDKAGQAKWDRRYGKASPSFHELIPAQVLVDYQHLLPETGQVLDLACGLGANALFLGNRELQVSAWDISSVAIHKLQQNAAFQGRVIETQVRDVVLDPPEAGSFNVIVVSRFLERGLFPALIAALKPGGLLFYQTFLEPGQVGNGGPGPNNPDYLLAANELLHLCRGMHVMAYREEGELEKSSVVTANSLRDARQWRHEAMIVAQRKADQDGGEALSAISG